MQLFQVIVDLRTCLQETRFKKRAVTSQQCGIDPVCLGKSACGLCKTSGKPGIDLGESNSLHHHETLECLMVGTGWFVNDPLYAISYP